jgi:hypothetical protein
MLARSRSALLAGFVVLFTACSSSDVTAPESEAPLDDETIGMMYWSLASMLSRVGTDRQFESDDIAMAPGPVSEFQSCERSGTFTANGTIDDTPGRETLRVTVTFAQCRDYDFTFDGTVKYVYAANVNAGFDGADYSIVGTLSVEIPTKPMRACTFDVSETSGFTIIGGQKRGYTTSSAGSVCGRRFSLAESPAFNGNR